MTEVIIALVHALDAMEDAARSGVPGARESAASLRARLDALG